MKQLLGIDIGTSACKVAVFDENGKVLAQANEPYKVYYPNPGWVEQDADEWWNAIIVAIKTRFCQTFPFKYADNFGNTAFGNFSSKGDGSIYDFIRKLAFT